MSHQVAIYASDNSGQIVGYQTVDDPNVTALQQGGGQADANGVWSGLPGAAPQGDGGGGGGDGGGGGPDYGNLDSIIGDLRGLSGRGASPNPTELQGFALLDKASNLDAMKKAYADYFGSIALPGMTNQATVAGQNRSGALTEATALGGASIGKDLTTLQKQLEEAAANARMSVGSQLFSREFLPLNAAGGLELGKTGQESGFDLGMTGIDASLLSQLLNFNNLPTGQSGGQTSGQGGTGTGTLGAPPIGTTYANIGNPAAA